MKRIPPKKSRHPRRQVIGRFPVVLQSDVSGGYWVNCPVLEGCYSQGDTMEEALRNIREAIELCLEDRIIQTNPARCEC